MEMGQKKVGQPVIIEVVAGDAHCGFVLPLVTQRGARGNGNLTIAGLDC